MVRLYHKAPGSCFARGDAIYVGEIIIKENIPTCWAKLCSLRHLSPVDVHVIVHLIIYSKLYLVYFMVGLMEINKVEDFKGPDVIGPVFDDFYLLVCVGAFTKHVTSITTSDIYDTTALNKILRVTYLW